MRMNVYFSLSLKKKSLAPLYRYCSKSQFMHESRGFSFLLEGKIIIIIPKGKK